MTTPHHRLEQIDGARSKPFRSFATITATLIAVAILITGLATIAKSGVSAFNHAETVVAVD